MYKVEKQLLTHEGEKVWVYEGTFKDTERLARACFNMGRLYGNVIDIRITEVE